MPAALPPATMMFRPNAARVTPSGRWPVTTGAITDWPARTLRGCCFPFTRNLWPLMVTSAAFETFSCAVASCVGENRYASRSISVSPLTAPE